MRLLLTDWTFFPTPKRKGAYWDEKEADVEGGGEVVIVAVNQSGERIPIVVFTGDERLEEYGRFPGADVTVLLKGGPIDSMIDHIHDRLSGNNRGRSL